VISREINRDDKKYPIACLECLSIAVGNSPSAIDVQNELFYIAIVFEYKLIAASSQSVKEIFFGRPRCISVIRHLYPCRNRERVVAAYQPNVCIQIDLSRRPRARGVVCSASPRVAGTKRAVDVGGGIGSRLNLHLVKI